MELKSPAREEARGCLTLNNKAYPLFEGHNKVGRDPKAAVTIKEATISRTHAIITILDEDGHYVSDFESSNGVRVYGKKLQPLKLYKLKSGTSITFGDVVCTYKKLDKGESFKNAKGGAASQSFSESFYGAATQEIQTPILPDEMNIHEMATQIFAPSINEMPTQLFSFDENRNESSSDSIDFMTMQKAETQSMIRNDDLPGPSDQVNPVRVLDDTGDDEILHPVKKKTQKLVDSDSDTEEYAQVPNSNKSKYHISDDSETDIEAEETKNEDAVAEANEESSGDSFSLGITEAMLQDAENGTPNVQAKKTRCKVVGPDHIYCRSTQGSQQTQGIEENEDPAVEERSYSNQSTQQIDTVPTTSNQAQNEENLHFSKDTVPAIHIEAQEEEYIRLIEDTVPTTCTEAPDEQNLHLNEDCVSQEKNKQNEEAVVTEENLQMNSSTIQNQNEDFDEPTQEISLDLMPNKTQEEGSLQLNPLTNEDSPTSFASAENTDKQNEEIVAIEENLQIDQNKNEDVCDEPTQEINLVTTEAQNEEEQNEQSVATEEENLQPVQNQNEDFFFEPTQEINLDLVSTKAQGEENLPSAANDQDKQNETQEISSNLQPNSSSNQDDNLAPTLLQKNKNTEDLFPDEAQRNSEWMREALEDDSFLQPTQTLDYVEESPKKSSQIEDLPPTQALTNLLGDENVTTPAPNEPEIVATQELANLLSSGSSQEKEDEEFLRPTQALENMYEDADQPSTSAPVNDDDFLPSTQALVNILADGGNKKDAFLFKTPSPLRKNKKVSTPKEPEEEEDFLQPTQALEVLHQDASNFDKVVDDMHDIFASQSLMGTQQLVEVLETSRDNDVIEDSMVEETPYRSLPSLRFKKPEPISEESVKNILGEGLEEKNTQELVVTGKGEGSEKVKTYSRKKEDEKKEEGAVNTRQSRRKLNLNSDDKETVQSSKTEEIGKKTGKATKSEDKEKERTKPNEESGESSRDIADGDLQGSTSKEETKRGGKRKLNLVNNDNESEKKVTQGNEESRQSSSDKNEEITGRSRRKQNTTEENKKEESRESSVDKNEEVTRRSKRKQNLTEDNRNEESRQNISDRNEETTGRSSRRKQNVTEENKKEESREISIDKNEEVTRRSKRKQNLTDDNKNEESRQNISDKNEETAGRSSRRKQNVTEENKKEESVENSIDKNEEITGRSRRKQNVTEENKKEESRESSIDKNEEVTRRSKRKQNVAEDNKKEESQETTRQTRSKTPLGDNIVKDNKKKDSQESSTDKNEEVTRRSKRNQMPVTDDGDKETKTEESKVSKGQKQNSDKETEKKDSQESSTDNEKRGRRKQNLMTLDKDEGVKKKESKENSTEISGCSRRKQSALTDDSHEETKKEESQESSISSNEETTRRGRRNQNPETKKKESGNDPKKESTVRRRKNVITSDDENQDNSNIDQPSTSRKRTTKRKSDDETPDQTPKKVKKTENDPKVSPKKRVFREDSSEDFVPKVESTPRSSGRFRIPSMKVRENSEEMVEAAKKPRRLSANSRRQKREEEETPQRSKRQLKPKVVFTMMDNPELESLIRQLGGSVVDTVDACTVLVTESVKRSHKLLCAVAQAKPICSPQWLQACKKASSFLDPWDYVIVDKEAEEKWGFSLRESLERASKGKLLDDHTFQIIVNSGGDVLKGAIESCGGKCVTRNLPKCESEHLMVVSSAANKTKWIKIVKQNPAIKVVDAEAIFDGTLRQEFNFDKFLLS